MARESHQVVVRFPNGVTLSIINDGYGTSGAPYEVYVMESPDWVGTAVVEAWGFQNDGIVGWLTATQLGELLLKVGGSVGHSVTADRH